MKLLIIDNTTNSIITLRKHVNLDYCNIFEKVNCLLKEDEKQPSKKRPNIFKNSISFFFVAKESFGKNDV